MVDLPTLVVGTLDLVVSLSLRVREVECGLTYVLLETTVEVCCSVVTTGMVVTMVDVL